MNMFCNYQTSVACTNILSAHACLMYKRRQKGVPEGFNLDKEPLGLDQNNCAAHTGGAQRHQECVTMPPLQLHMLPNKLQKWIYCKKSYHVYVLCVYVSAAKKQLCL